MSDPNLKGESVEHRNRIANEIQRAINDGFSFIRKNHKLIHPETGKYIRVDVYAEKKDEIRIREVVCTHWSGKDPIDYLKTVKRIDSQIININSEGKTLDELKQRLEKEGNGFLFNFRLSREEKDDLKHVANKLTQGSRATFLKFCIYKFNKYPELWASFSLEDLREYHLNETDELINHKLGKTNKGIKTLQEKLKLQHQFYFLIRDSLESEIQKALETEVGE